MLKNLVVPEQEYQEQYESHSDCTPVIININTGKPIPVLRHQIYPRFSTLKHCITFQTPFKCVLIDFMLPVNNFQVINTVMNIGKLTNVCPN